MTAARHILGTFDEALASLRNNVLMMSSLTERSLERAMKGLFIAMTIFAQMRSPTMKRSINSRCRSIRMAWQFCCGFSR